MDLKAKQDYLFTEILEANYDPEVFQEYIEKRKGVNLDNYTMEELIDIVQSFKGNDKDKQIEKQEPQAKSKEEEASSAVKEEIDRNESMVRMEQSLIKQRGEFKKSDSLNTSTKVYHQLVKKTTVSKIYRLINEEKENIRVKIRSYSKETDESLFGSTYIMYLLETSNGWSVKRRFKDFQWLHSRLALMYPGLPVPPIPKKTTIRSFEDKHLEERMISFEYFVNRLLKIPEICSDEILEQFLRVANQQEFTTCKERYEIRLNNNGNRIVSLKGERVINMGEYAIDAKLTKFHTTSLDFIRTLNMQLGAFQKALKTATERAFELSSTFNEAYKHLQKNQVNCAQVVELMGDFVSELGYRLEGEYFFVKNNLEDYWAYEEKYEENLLNNISKLNKEQYQILSKSKNLAMQSEMDIDDSAHKNKAITEYLSNKQLYRIRLSFFLEEMERHKTHDLPALAKQWVSALQQYVGGIKDLMLSGADQLTKGMCICQGKKLVEVEYLSSQKQKEGLR